MKFRLLAAAIVLAPFAFAPGAHAQGGCDNLKRIVADALDAFPTLRGDEIDDDWFDSKLYLQDADECTIDLSIASAFSCAWGFDEPADADAFSEQLEQGAQYCLPEWEWEAIEPGAKLQNNLPVTRGIRMIGNGETEDTLIQIYAEAFPDSPERTVWLEVVQP